MYICNFIKLDLLLNVVNIKIADLFLSLRGMPINGDGFVDVEDIGEDDTPDNHLLCLTNDTNCCGDSDPGGAKGNWFFPDRTSLRAPIASFSDSNGSNFFYTKRGTRVIRLQRHNNPSERGRFRCVLYGSTIYANICE